MSKLPRVSEARKAFAANVARFRGPDQKKADFAEKLGMAPGTWSSMQSGRGKGLPEMETALRCAIGVGKLLEELLARVDADYDALRKKRLDALRLNVDPVTGLFLPAPEQPAPSPVVSEDEKMTENEWLKVGPHLESLNVEQRKALQLKATQWVLDALAGRTIGGATGNGSP